MLYHKAFVELSITMGSKSVTVTETVNRFIQQAAMRTAIPEQKSTSGEASEAHAVVRLEHFVPKLVLESPEKPVYVCQGTVLHVRLPGLDAEASEARWRRRRGARKAGQDPPI